MAIHLQGGPACLLVIAILALPAVAVAAMLHSAIWLLVVPILLVATWVGIVRFLPRKRMTESHFADALERHLNGTEGKWDWDDITSVGLADERLDRLRVKLSKFDSLILEERRNELARVIAALRRGEIPEIQDD